MSICLLNDLLLVCDDPVWSSSKSTFKLAVTRGTIDFSALRELKSHNVFVEGISHESHSDLQSNYDSGLSGQVPQHSSLTLQIPRTVSGNVVVESLADLISIHSATWRVPKGYLLVREEESGKPFCFTDQSSLASAPAPVAHYHDAIELWGFLKSQADVANENEHIVFFGVRRIEIEPIFGVNELQAQIPIAQIKSFVAGADPQKTRIEIFRSVLSEFLRDLPPERAFRSLLTRADLFVRRLSEGLAIYLAAHSPEQLAEEATEKHFDLAEKLDKVITSMEAKSLTIPAAILLAVKEVKFGEGFVTLNTVILVSAALYFVAMTVSHFSQRSMLLLLKRTIEETISDLKSQGLSDANEVLAGSFESLRQRRKNTTVGTWLMLIFSTAPLFAVLYGAFLAPVPKTEPPKEPSVKTLPANS